jgi:hypothetical protein
MKASDPESPGRGARLREWLGAWQPFTGGGVAAFAEATWTRTVLYQAVFAVAVAVVVTWFVWGFWWPVLDRAAAALPDAARIERGRLVWPDDASVVLADSPHLGIAVRPLTAELPGRIADVQVEIFQQTVRLNGVAGHAGTDFPADLTMSLERRDAVATLGAWKWPSLAATALTAALSVWLSWCAVATLFAGPLWLMGLLARRDAAFGGCWRMIAAALLPGVVIAIAGVVAYATLTVRLPGLAVFVGASIAAGPIWAIWGLFCRPRRMTAGRSGSDKNPFQTEAAAQVRGGSKNPFASGS